jgi:hypothetical protein
MVTFQPCRSVYRQHVDVVRHGDVRHHTSIEGESMDLSAFTKSDWMKVGGAVGFFIFGFFNWVTIEFAGVSASGFNVFHFFWTGTLPWLLVMGVAALTVLLALKVLDAKQLPWPLIMLAASGLAAVLLVLRLLFNPIDGSDALEIIGGDVGRGIGMYLSVISGLVVFAGAFLGFTESGGDLNDLKDVNKLKSQFGVSSSESGGTPPPPPPPPPTTPPPPPPPAP